MTLNDLEPPKGFLVNFSQFLDATHISGHESRNNYLQLRVIWRATASWYLLPRSLLTEKYENAKYVQL